ncbi:hypothetical protein [Roseicella frigidaeris]|uniref:Uncharacterized protein n=1 Tax=Roseicella frigidaeris TaxID=2230885 RepID=A0A327M8Z3_9PROT|nr:hypothetical protein [Roseicella frigidaeris]RAI58603.1 hypothetical protein DOO78_13000 [Roseicella frigidaeris]
MRARSAVALLTMLALGGGAAAQPAAGTQPLDNREPRPGQVRDREQAVGVAPDRQQSRKEGQTVDQLYRELTGSDPNAPAKPRPAPQDRPAPAR